MARHNWQFDLQWTRACGAVVVGFVLASGALKAHPPVAPMAGMQPVVTAVTTLRGMLGAAVAAAAAMLHQERC